MQEEKEKEGEGEDQRCEEGKFDREHEAFGGIKRLHENHATFGIELCVGIAFDEGLQLFTLFFGEIGNLRHVIGPLLFGYGKGDAEVKGRLDMEGKVLVFGIGKFLKVLSLGRVEADGIIGHPHRFFPNLHRGPGIEFLESTALGLGPDLFDRTTDDVHEVVTKDVANQSGQHEGEDDARERDAQVIEVGEKGFFGLRIGLIADFKKLLQEKHGIGPRRAGGN